MLKIQLFRLWKSYRPTIISIFSISPIYSKQGRYKWKQLKPCITFTFRVFWLWRDVSSGLLQVTYYNSSKCHCCSWALCCSEYVVLLNSLFYSPEVLKKKITWEDFHFFTDFVLPEQIEMNAKWWETLGKLKTINFL